MDSETAVSFDYQVQEHASGWCCHEGHGPPVDVEHQLVLFVYLWIAVGLQLPSWKRQRYVFTCPLLKSRAFKTDSITAASQMAQQMNQMGGAQAPQMFGPGVDPDKQFLAEAENLAVIEHYSVLDDVEKRLLEGIKA